MQQKIQGNTIEACIVALQISENYELVHKDLFLNLLGGNTPKKVQLINAFKILKNNLILIKHKN